MNKDFPEMYFAESEASTTIPDNTVVTTIRIAHSNYIN
jgi:hypothetical protein